MDNVVIANRPIGRPRRPKTYPSGRVCDHDFCMTKLSSYNKQEQCHTHAPVSFPRVRGQFLD